MNAQEESQALDSATNPASSLMWPSHAHELPIRFLASSVSAPMASFEDPETIEGPAPESTSIACGESFPGDNYFPILDPVSPEALNPRLGGQDEKDYYMRVYNRLSNLQKSILTQHASDLRYFAKKRDSLFTKMKNNTTVVLLESAARLLFRILLLSSWSMYWMRRPIETLYLSIYFAVIYPVLLGINMLFLWGHLLGVDKFVSYSGQKYAGGMSIVNWGNINLFKAKRHIFDSAKPALSCNSFELKITPPARKNPEICNGWPKKRLEFNVDIARAILLMCAIVYERDTKSIETTAKALLSNTGLDEGVLELVKSEHFILRHAEEWGLRFVSIADFRTVGSGPFAGVFYNYEHLRPGENPFCVLVIKGTSPGTFRDWITDFDCNYEACGDFLATGLAHGGFYNALFPSKSSGEEFLPYSRIIEGVKMIARCAREATGLKSNFFLGGHSLGAGTVSLIYARLLESPEDLGDDIVLRDIYAFGSPRVCDAKLATRFEFNLNKPINHGRQLWRVANRSLSSRFGDCVTRVPPGIADKRNIRPAVLGGSTSAFAAIGIRVDLKPNNAPRLNYSITEVPVGYEVDVCKLDNEMDSEPAPQQRITSKQPLPQNVVQFTEQVFAKMIPILHDHLPSSYMDSLDQMHAQVRSRIRREPDSVHKLGSVDTVQPILNALLLK